MTATCCASFWPKNATSGWAMLKSLVTTVATPAKCSGPRDSPSSGPETPPTVTVVAKPGG